MKEVARRSMAQDLMMRFTRLTSLVGDGAPQRYLWTLCANTCCCNCDILQAAAYGGGLKKGESASGRCSRRSKRRPTG
jgi:hypothetical protein